MLRPHRTLWRHGRAVWLAVRLPAFLQSRPCDDRDDRDDPEPAGAGHAARDRLPPRIGAGRGGFMFAVAAVAV